MKACVKAFRLQKAGNAASEYEDSFWPQVFSCEEDLPMRVAVADGATDAVFSGLWANILVRLWGRQRQRMNAPCFRQGIGKQAELWRRRIRNSQLPWYVEEKARMGAYAAFIGVELNHTLGSSSGTWSAVACGDCCLFQVRNRELITSFPISQSSEFSNSPLLLSTNPMDSGELSGMQTSKGAWEEGDCLYLMSDALACWFLAKCESGPVPWSLLSDITLTENPSFESWLADLREKHELKNDDCTLMSIEFE